MACPVIWGRRYSWLPFCPVCCVVFFQPRLCHISLTCIFPSQVWRPLLLFPGMYTSSILLTMCSSFILITWPYHFSRFPVIALVACTTLVVPLMCSFRILSLLVTPHIHLSILISNTSSRASFPLIVAQVSAPYSIMLQEISGENSQMCLKMNIAKTKVMGVDNMLINVNNVLIENVEGCAYLHGATLQPQGKEPGQILIVGWAA